MATLADIGVSAAINILSAFAFLLAFALLRIQPINDRIYFPKWYISGDRSSPRRSGGNFVGKFVNLNFRTYLTFLNWMPQALRMSESEIISHAGLDSAAFLRIYTLGLNIFVPITLVALLVLIPVNVSSGTLFFLKKELVVSDIDKLSISNVPPKSIRFFVHIALEYLFTIWICFLLYKEYDHIASMRLHFLASQRRRVDQFAVVVRNIPHMSGHTISDTVDSFFQTNHPEHYIGHQAVYNANKFAKFAKRRDRLQNWLDYYQLKFERHPDKRPTVKNGFLGFWGGKVDAIEYYKHSIKELDTMMTMERQKIIKDPKSILPVAFLSFKSRWGASVCAQTQQSKNPTLWLTDWAPEPRDVYWQNLAIPFVSLNIRKLIISLSVFALVFFYMIPIAFVQSLANLEGLERVAPFLRPVIELKFIKSFLQGFLPGLALKIFLYILPTVLMIMSKIEGYIALSTLERKTAAKYYYFMLVNVFLGSIVTGTAFQQLHAFLHQSPTQIPRTIGVSIPMKATFFMTYIMVDGWAGIAGEILRLKPLVIYHLKNMFLVKTERDRGKAMDPGSVDFPETIPSLQLYFLLGIVYAVVTPILLPFVLVFFAFAYLVYRHQIINVYNQQYESAAAFWPLVHSRIIASLLISQLLLLGLLSTKKAAKSTPLLVILPILTFAFHKFCQRRFEPAFRKYPLEEAMSKDLLEKSTEPDLNIEAYLADAYLHPIFRSFEVDDELVEVRVDNHQTNVADSQPSEPSSPSPPHHVQQPSPPHHIHEPSPPQYRTTGVSKGVVLSHKNLVAMVELFVRFEASQYEGSCLRNVYLAVLPMFHVYGLSLFAVGLLSLGSTVVVMRKFDIDEVVRVIDEYKVTHFPVVPPMLTALIKRAKGVNGGEFQSLVQVSSGAAPLSMGVINEFIRAFPNVDFIQGYGMTESTAVGTRGFNTEKFRNYSSIGLLAPNMEAKVVDWNTGAFLPPGSSGELRLRGPSIMTGYLNNEEVTMSTIDKDGWLHTGDVVYFDHDGYLHISDRLKDIIKYKGFQIAPADLEAVLILHPEVVDVAVTRAMDEETGEIPVAFVVRKVGSVLSPKHIMDFVAEQVAPYKKVRKVFFTDKIPRSATGKILRKQLRNYLTSNL